MKTAARARFPAIAFGLLAMLLFACNIAKDGKDPETFSFTKLSDSLSKFDSVHIILKNQSGDTLDMLFRGIVRTAADVQNRPAPHYTGGNVVIAIVGYKHDAIVYLVDRQYNGATGKTDAVLPIILPTSTVGYEILELKVLEEDSVPIPKVIVLPLGLADTGVTLTTSKPDIMGIGKAHIIGRKRGFAELIARLKSDPSKEARIIVVVDANPGVPESVNAYPETVSVAAGGSPGRFFATVTPSTAPGAVTWFSGDKLKVDVSATGEVRGLKPGAVRVWAVSGVKGSVGDSVWAIVTDPVPVQRVQFLIDSLELFAGGAAESLVTQVLPPQANQSVDFYIKNIAALSLTNNKVKGAQEGIAYIYARSSDDPSKLDSLRVIILPNQKIDQVDIVRDTATLFVGGATLALTATVVPSSLAPKLQWRSSATEIVTVDASGILTPVAAGIASVYALSRADSLKRDSILVTVKKDVPVLKAGNDTTVAVGASVSFRVDVSQEYGGISIFRWDMDGDGIPEGTAARMDTLLTFTYATAKNYQAAFYVKDTEGNEATGTKRIKAVSGPVIRIESPLPNSYATKAEIPVVWYVDNRLQDTANTELLKQDGANIITRYARDSVGGLFSAAINVYLDSSAPSAPAVQAISPINSKTPKWTWAATSLDGSGIFRYRLDNVDLSAAEESGVFQYTAGANLDLKEGTHVLYVQERDAALNWSPSGSKPVVIDLTPPDKPTVNVAQTSPSNAVKSVWSWTTGGKGDKAVFRYRFDVDDFATGGTETRLAGLTDSTLSDGIHTLFVQEGDSAGNWSLSGSASLTLDRMVPNKPNVTMTPVYTRNNKPTWTWTSGGNGGSGYYAVSFDTAGAAAPLEVHDTVYVHATPLPQGKTTLYVREKDATGNWSGYASAFVFVDSVAPGKPVFAATPYSPVNSTKPTWTWASGGGGDIGSFRCKLDDSIWSSGSVIRTVPNFTPSIDIPEGKHVLWIQEKDSAGNYSQAASRELFLTKSKVVGTEGFSPGGYDGIYVAGVNLTLSGTDVPYVVFEDYSRDAKTTVMTFNGSAWVNVGNPGFSKGRSFLQTIAVGKTGTPYVAYADEGFNTKVCVKKLVGGVWDSVGTSGFSTGMSYNLNMALDNSDVPIVAYEDYQNGDAVVVKYFNGTNWVNYGNTPIATGMVDQLSMALNSKGEPYVLFSDIANGGKATVMACRSGVWSVLGSPGFSSDGIFNTVKLTVSKSDTAYAVYREMNNSILTVMKFNGTSWVKADDGSMGFSGYASPNFTATGALFSGLDGPGIKGLIGGKWFPMEMPTLAVGSAGFVSLVPDKNGVPFLAFRRADGRVTVIKAGFAP